MNGPSPHHRQLAIGPEPLEALPGWLTVALDADTFVSHCPSLRSDSTHDVDGAKWVLLGLAAQTRGGAPDPLQGIAAARTADVPKLYPDWSGRWLLVGAGGVHLDASGLLGCFYGEDERGRTWASSSPALLSRQIGTPSRDPGELRYGEGLSWYPPPRSGFARMRRLLPSQVLRFGDHAPEPRPLLPPIEPARPYDRTLELLQGALVEALQRLPPTGRPLALALSAGLDSRVVLAAAERAAVPYVPFVRIAARMPPADRLIPAQLSGALGRSLETHRRGRRKGRRAAQQRLPLVREHSVGHVSDGDAQPLLHGVRDGVEGISAGGWGFGVGKALGRATMPASYEDAGSAAEQFAAALGEPPASPAMAGLRQWLEWAARTPQNHLDLRDRFYIEQRMAGWQSSKEQVYDMLPLERFPPINSARCYALLLSVDEKRRAAQQHQLDLVERLCPPLAEIPVNPPIEELSLPRLVAATLRNEPAGLLPAGWRHLKNKLRRAA